MLSAPVLAATPGRAGGSGFHLPAPGTPQGGGSLLNFIPGLAIPGLAQPASGG